MSVQLSALRLACITGMVGLLLSGCAHRDDWPDLENRSSGIVAWKPPELPADPGQIVLRWNLAGEVAKVDADVQNAPRDAVVRALCEGSKMAYRIPSVPLTGRCTFRLEGATVLAALKVAVHDIELEPEILPGPAPMLILTEKEIPTPPPQYAKATDRYFTKAYSPVHQSAQRLFETLFKNTEASEGLLASSAIPALGSASVEANRLYLRGHPDCLTRLLRMVRAADVPSTRLRAEVYTYARRPISQTVKTKSSLAASQGQISASMDLTSADQQGLIDLIQLGVQAAHSSMQQAVIQALEDRELGQYLAGSEIVVSNGEPLFLNVGRTGYILTTEFFNGTPATQSTSVSASNQFKVTPYLLPDRSVRLEMEIDASKFEDVPPLSGNVLRNYRSITVQIPLNTIVAIQGVTRPESRLRNFGVSVLRKIPILGFFASNTDTALSQAVDMTLLRISLVEEGNLDPLPHLAEDACIPICDQAEPVRNTR
jgi:hypothetical protein